MHINITITESSMGVGYDKINGTPTNESYRVAMKYAFRGASYRASNPLYWTDALYRLSRHGRIFYRHVRCMQQYTDNVRIC